MVHPPSSGTVIFILMNRAFHPSVCSEHFAFSFRHVSGIVVFILYRLQYALRVSRLKPFQSVIPLVVFVARSRSVSVIYLCSLSGHIIFYSAHVRIPFTGSDSAKLKLFLFSTLMSKMTRINRGIKQIQSFYLFKWNYFLKYFQGIIYFDRIIAV